jgi:hypothetical protein
MTPTTIPGTVANFDPRADRMKKEAARLVECRFRRPGGNPSCGYVDEVLGWRHGMSLEDCDRCFKAGKDTADGEIVRNNYASKVVTKLLELDPSRVAVPVLLTIARKHVNQPQARQILRGVAVRMSEEEVTEEAARLGADFEREIREKRAGATPEELLDAEDKKSRWARVKQSWQKAESFAKSIASAGLLQEKEVDPVTFEKRTVSCFGLSLEQERVQDPCPSLVVGSDGGHYCNDCGCGERSLAKLDKKLTYPYLECPRRRDGFSNALSAISPTPLTVSGEMPKRGVGLPDGATVVENICFGIGDACVFSWVMHSARAAGLDKVFLNPMRNLETFDIFGVPSGWRTTEPGPKPGWHPPKGYIGGKGWLRAWLDEYLGVEGVPFVRPSVLEDAPDVAAWADAMWEGRDAATGTKGRRVLIYPEVVWKTRAWPMPHFSLLAQGMLAEGLNPLVQTREYNGDHPFAYSFGGVGLKRMVAMMRRADLVIGNDSGPAHFAGTLGVKTLVLTGPSPVPQFFEHLPEVTCFTVNDVKKGPGLPCVGCNFQWAKGFHKRCDHGCGALMLLHPVDVLDKAKEMLGG